MTGLEFVNVQILEDDGYATLKITPNFPHFSLNIFTLFP